MLYFYKLVYQTPKNIKYINMLKYIFGCLKMVYTTQMAQEKFRRDTDD